MIQNYFAFFENKLHLRKQKEKKKRNGLKGT
jgi:hypothetical protein